MMRKEISDDVTNPIKSTSHRQHQRSRSLDAFDNLDLLEAQKRFRQKYLQNRAVFERSNNDAADSVRPIKDWTISKSRRFSTEAESSTSTVLEPDASTKVRSNDEVVLRAPSLVRDISTKYITPVHKSMLETKYKEAPSKSLSNSLPVTPLNRSTHNNMHLRRTMSAREGNMGERNVSRINGIDSVKSRWSHQATPTYDPFQSANHYFRKHSPSPLFDVTDSAVEPADTRQTKLAQGAVAVGGTTNGSEFQSDVHYARKHSPLATAGDVEAGVNTTGTFHMKPTYPNVGVGDVSNRPDFKSPLSYSRVYSLPTIGNETREGVSKTAEKKLNNNSNLFDHFHRPVTSAQSQRHEKHVIIADSAKPSATEGKKHSGFLFPPNTNTITYESPQCQNDAEIFVSPGVFSASPRTPLAYSTYKMGLLNKTWKPVPVHRHNSFNDGTTQDIDKTRDYRPISRTKSDLDKYRTVAGTSNQNTFAIGKPQSVRSTLPLVSLPSAKLVVKARDEILPSTASLKTQFRKFNPPTS